MKSLSETLSAKNKAFWAKPKQYQCVSVAKDVLKQLTSRFFKAKKGDYLNIIGLKETIKAPAKMDKAFTSIKLNGGRCEVCGIGACFTSLVNIGDTVNTNPVFGKTISKHSSGMTDPMRRVLRKVFTSEQLTLIECAFEVGVSYVDKDYISFEEREKASDFGEKYRTDAARLKAIMNNIIKNKGTFIP
jgi:hypothetical protein